MVIYDISQSKDVENLENMTFLARKWKLFPKTRRPGLRPCTSVLFSRLRLSHLLFVTSLCFLLMVSIVSLSVCYVTMLSLQGFHCFIICLLGLSLPLLVSSLFIQAISVASLQANYHSEALHTQ